MRRQGAVLLALVLATAGAGAIAPGGTDPAPAQSSTTTYLSDLPWVSVRNGYGPVERDRSVGGAALGDGGPIRLKTTTYAKGLGTHPVADITYDLARRYTRFASDVGIDAVCGGAGSVDFQVFVDGAKLFDQRVRGTDPIRAVSVDVTNKAMLRLVVTDGGDGFNCDHADWAGARLLSGTTPPTTAPATTSTTSTPTPTTVPPPGPLPPDVVLVLADDMRPDEMERVAQLAPDGGFAWVRSHGVRTKLWYSDNLCCPSRTTILTGQTPYNHRVFTNATFTDLQWNSLPIWLRSTGYCTGFTGRYLNAFNASRPRPAGWTYWEPLTAGYDREVGYSIMRRDRSVWSPSTFITDHLADVARAQLRDCTASGRSAFVNLWPFAPHFNSDPEPGYANVVVPWSNADPSFNEAQIGDKPPWLRSRYPSVASEAYYAALHATRVRTLLSVDDALKAIIDDAAARGRLDRTVFIVTSDNGFLLGEHRVDSRKELAYEAAQSSLWIAGPGFPVGLDSDAFVQNMDLTRTILEIANASRLVDLARQVDGVPLQQLLASPSRGHNRFLPLYVPVEAPGSWSRPTGEGVRTWRYKYLSYADGTAELYDLATDPYELHNVIGVEAYRSVRSAMRSLLQERKACRGDGCRIPAPSQLQG